ncbi:uncharacterized protein LOC119454715 [Dermacentor silvarum]|uniref:uncharacterized protein LOC119454715 n=1 Tax=Dermacentor silvarum TaxID=543639 RepID=UPI002100F129|nr:uncharacterized protein LOC119454715 [Dermacentor silvarum]
MEDLMQGGITWTDGTTFISSQVHPFSCSADAPARAIMQNMRQFNGRFSCGWCLHPGTIVDGTIKYTIDEPVPDRTMEETINAMKTAARTGTIVQGIKGPTPLINMPHFDIIWGFTPDYMHCVLLGVARQFTKLWLSSVGQPYYIGRAALLSAVDKRLCNIKPPLCFRLQRTLSLQKYWKATEWQQWLLWFSLPCLDGILTTEYLKHFTLLIKGVSLLLMDNVSSTDVSENASLLVKFVVGVQFLYEEKEMTFNVHQLLHLPKSVVLQGPLWSHSCFVFESNIGHVKELVTSAKGVPIQIVERLLMASSFASLKASALPQTREFLTKDNGAKCGAVVSMIGKPRKTLQPVLNLVMNHIGCVTIGPIVEHDKVAVSRYVFHSKQYKRPNKTDCTAAMLPSGACATISHILGFKDIAGKERVFAVCEKFDTCQTEAPHIHKAQGLQSSHVFEVKSGIVPCLYMEIEQAIFFAPLAFKALFKNR